MKKILLLIFALPLLATAQEKLSVVTLKNGTELTGVIKAIDPTDALTISIAGIETTIRMADVASVKEAVAPIASVTSNEKEAPKLLSDEKLVVTDYADYPDSYDLKVGEAKIKMILVRGGEMNMGFDGPHSIWMDSEPVHKVKVTSFYISETYVTKDIARQITGKGGKNGYCIAYKWKIANDMAEKIAEFSGIPVRLPTEAEWEFAACSSVQELIFTKCNDVEYCSDWFEKFGMQESRIDPQGPQNGRRHVVRAYNRKHGKFNRSHLKEYETDCRFRLVIKAKDI